MSDDFVSTDWIADCSSILLRGRYLCSEVFKDVSPERFLAAKELYRRADALNTAVTKTLNEVFATIWHNSGVYYFWPGYVVSYGARLDEVESVAVGDSISIDQFRRPAHPAGYGYDLIDQNRFHLTPLAIWMELFYGQIVDGIRIRGFTQYVAAIRKQNTGPLADCQGRPVHCIAMSTEWSGTQYAAGVLYSGLVDAGSPAELARILNGHLQAAFGHGQSFPPVESKSGYVVPSEEAEHFESIFYELLWSIFHGHDQSDRSRLADLERRLTLWAATDAASRVARAAGLLEQLEETERDRAFRYYYVIPLESALGPSARLAGRLAGVRALDLGTINIYSTNPIPASLIHLLKPWLQSMYAQLRLLETFDHAVSRAVQMERITQAHELKELVGVLDKQDRTAAQLSTVADAFRALLGIVPQGFKAPESLRAAVSEAIDIAQKVETVIEGTRLINKVLLDPTVTSLAVIQRDNVSGWWTYVLALVSAIRNAVKNSTGDITILFDGDILIRNPGPPPSALSAAKNHLGSSKEAVRYFLTQTQGAFALAVAPDYDWDYIESLGEWHTSLEMPLLAKTQKP